MKIGIIKKGLVFASLILFSINQPALSAAKNFEVTTESLINMANQKMTINSKMSYSDKKVRMENEIITKEKLPQGMNKSIMIMDSSKKIAYTLMPQNKSAMKIDMAVMEKMQGASGSGAGLTSQFVSDPSQVQSQIKKMGGKMVGAESILGYLCDIWSMNQEIQVAQDGTKEKATVKIWLSNKLSIPLKMEVTSPKKGNFISMKAKSLKTDVKLPDSLFEVPSGYQVIDMNEMMKKMKNTKQLNGK